MGQELKSHMLRALAAAATLTPDTTLPQKGDTDLTLLAKINALMHTLNLGKQRSGVLMDESGVLRQVKRSDPKNIAQSQTDSVVVAAVAGYAIRVLNVYALAGGTATNLTFNSKPGGAGAAISALLANDANGGEVLPYNPHGWFQTAIGEGLSVTTGAGATTGLQVSYILVPNYLTDELGNPLTDELGNYLTA